MGDPRGHFYVTNKPALTNTVEKHQLTLAKQRRPFQPLHSVLDERANGVCEPIELTATLGRANVLRLGQEQYEADDDQGENDLPREISLN